MTVAACGASSTGGTTAQSASAQSSVHLQNTAGTAHGDVASATWDLPYGEPSTLDPDNGAYYNASLVTDQLCDTLLRFGPNYKVEPDLATAKQVNPLTLVFNLRHDVKFWNGDPMTSADVVYSLDHAFSPNSATGALFTAVRSVVATGKYQVTLHFSHPDELVEKEMPSFASAIFEKKQAIHAGSKFGSAQGGIMCSGPYELTKWTPGSSIVVTANPHYWDPARAAHIKKLTFTFATNSTTIAEGLISGQTDGAYEVPAETLPRLKESGKGNLHFGPAPIYLQLSVATSSGPLGNLNLRKALFTSINRASLASIVYHGAAQPVYTQLTPESWDASTHAQWERAYQPYAKAGAGYGSAQSLAAGKKLVSASGYKATPITLATLAGDATLDEVAELIQQQAKLIGLNVTIRSLQPIQYANAGTSAKARAGIDLILATSFNVAQDPIEQMTFDQLPGSFYNYTDYNNPQVNRDVAEARASYSPRRQTQLLINAQSTYEKQWRSATLLDLDEISYVNNALSGEWTSFPYMLTSSMSSIGAAH
jgi:peptide/nickel transport system substrate-binding protein